MNAPTPEHALRAHAYLSCSSSDRWLNCTVAPSLEAKYSDEGSVYAQEGTTAHELAERCLRTGKDADAISGTYPQEMRDYVQVYLDYVREVASGTDHLLVEERLDVSSWVPECFGTSDAVVMHEGEVCHVIDLKYGKGIRVDAADNSQLKLYALGAYSAFEASYGEFQRFELHVVQPRLDHIDTWSISAVDLLAWGASIRPIAQLAFRGAGEASAGDHCHFCKARHTCRARYEANMKLAKGEFGDTPKAAELTDNELAAIYPRLDAFIRWANEIQSFCLARVESGCRLPGLKLVEGRSVRKINDERGAIAALRGEGLDDFEFLNIKPKGITDLEKLLGKKKFSELLGGFIVRPSGKPVLVTEDDPRPEMSGITSAQADFNE